MMYNAGRGLEVIQNPSAYLDDFDPTVRELESLIAEQTADRFRFDLKYANNQGEVRIFVDTKNYLSLSKIFAPESQGQFLAYLKEIRGFSELRIVQFRRPGMTLDKFKKALQIAFERDNYKIYDQLVDINP